MIKNYESPQIEVIEIELENSILAASDVPSGTDWSNNFINSLQ